MKAQRQMNQMRHDADTEQLIPSIFFLLKKWESITWNREARTMNWEQLEGKWKQYKGEVREKWGKLTDDDLHIIAGRREQLIGRLQERYGIRAAHVYAHNWIDFKDARYCEGCELATLARKMAYVPGTDCDHADVSR